MIKKQLTKVTTHHCNESQVQGDPIENKELGKQEDWEQSLVWQKISRKL